MCCGPACACAHAQGHAAVAEFFGYVGLLCTLALAPLVGLLALLGVYSLDDVPHSALWIILLEGAVRAGRHGGGGVCGRVPAAPRRAGRRAGGGGASTQG